MTKNPYRKKNTNFVLLHSHWINHMAFMGNWQNVVSSVERRGEKSPWLYHIPEIVIYIHYNGIRYDLQ